MAPERPALVFCPTCRRSHRGVVVLDPTGWPTVRWSEAHDSDAVLRYHLDALAEAGGKALALMVDVGDWDRAEEVLGRVLSRFDPEEGPS